MTTINNSNSSNERQPLTPDERQRLNYIRESNKGCWTWDFDGIYHDGATAPHDFGDICVLHQHVEELIAIIEALTTPPEPVTTTDPTIRYVYGMRNRPAGYATCPDGRLTDLDNPTDARATFGTVVYERELTVHDLYRYEMFPVDPLPALPLYPEGAHVRDIRNHKEFTVEFFDGDWWVGSALLRTVQDWLFYEPCLSTPPEPPATRPEYASIESELAAQGLRRANIGAGEPGWYVTTSFGKVWATDEPVPDLETRLTSGNPADRTIARDEVADAIALAAAGKVEPIEGHDFVRMPAPPAPKLSKAQRALLQALADGVVIKHGWQSRVFRVNGHSISQRTLDYCTDLDRQWIKFEEIDINERRYTAIRITESGKTALKGAK